jgi:hypothetical protein
LIIATRNIFNAKLASEARVKILNKLIKIGFDTLIMPDEETPTGLLSCAMELMQAQE